uniref:Uncharacterized protein n=1 Tax=Ananas comosus var. bracteatus TaxID=296719 RepID=A0A6V7NJS4_ANACO|nr:unnamed protein product [Ananas comosus var. bracteatus]
MPPRSASDKRIRSSSGRALGSIGSMSRRSKSRECRRTRTRARRSCRSAVRAGPPTLPCACDPRLAPARAPRAPPPSRSAAPADLSLPDPVSFVSPTSSRSRSEELASPRGLISGVLQISICYFKSVPVLDSATWHLLDENEQLLIQIASNLEFFKIQENMDPFLRTSNNIATILNRMSQTPGIMCRMPPLPISLNEEHLDSLIQFSRRGLCLSSLTSE